ncbi:hypothetical protein [Mesorhizobium sp.]|uniref:hypothetical protein n=1 Tax=Mesorhizobium sp. TaxID=1871066 RepID=UPI000FE744FB|nr:hypothetical protein [Mesorhizobium sp.]RWE96472.1 MAG: hypothetical protein EOS43_22485 [Mesorhizobium sp.]
MAEIALGWLGWTEEQALRTDVNAIRVAYQGRTSMLRAIFGGEDEPEPKKQPITTGDQFDAMFGVGRD